MKHRLAYVLPVYLAAYCFTYFCAYQLRFEFAWTAEMAERFSYTLPVVLMIKMAIAAVSGEWRRSFRFSAFGDFVCVGLSVLASSAVVLAASFLIFDSAIPRSVIVIDMLLTLATLGAVRSAFRLVTQTWNTMSARNEKLPTLIYGTDKQSLGILRTLKNTQTDHQIVGFVDEGQRANGVRVAGLLVLSLQEGWKKLARQTRVSHVLIPSSIDESRLRSIVGDCMEAGLKPCVVPDVREVVSGHYALSSGEFSAAQLLRETPITLDIESMRKHISNRRIIVTGDSKSVGSELCRQLLDFGPESLVFVDNDETNIFALEDDKDDPATLPMTVEKTDAGPGGLSIDDEGHRLFPSGVPFNAVETERRWYLAVKNTIDLGAGILIGIFAIPIIAMCAAAVKLTSRGPAFYSQLRVGKDGEVFRIWKLRTMVQNAETGTGAVWAKTNDSRITPVGRLLRDSHLDEFPQLINVLSGKMSLVGPRPERPEFVTKLKCKWPHYQNRHRVRPGITGLAQMNLPPDTDLESVRKKLVHDLYYVRNASPWLDLRILVFTFWKFVKGSSESAWNAFRLPSRGDAEQTVLELVGEQAGLSAESTYHDAPAEEQPRVSVRSAA